MIHRLADADAMDDFVEAIGVFREKTLELLRFHLEGTGHGINLGIKVFRFNGKARFFGEAIED